MTDLEKFIKYVRRLGHNVRTELLLRAKHRYLLTGTCPIVVAVVHSGPEQEEDYEIWELFTPKGKTLRESITCPRIRSSEPGFVMGTD